MSVLEETCRDQGKEANTNCPVSALIVQTALTVQGHGNDQMFVVKYLTVIRENIAMGSLVVFSKTKTNKQKTRVHLIIKPHAFNR